MRKDEILEFLKKRKADFAERYQIKKIALFGSYAREEATEKSDIDIAIETPCADYFKLYDLKEELEMAFGHCVDLIRLRKGMNPSLKRRILREGIDV